MLQDGTSRIHAIALTRVGSNENVTRLCCTTTASCVVKKENMKQADKVRSLVKARRAKSKTKSQAGSGERKKALVVKKEEPDSD